MSRRSDSIERTFVKPRKDAPGEARAAKAGEPPAKVSKKALRSAATRAALKDAVVRCFAEKGFLGTTIDDITRAAGVSHAAFYLYFKDKEALYLELVHGTAREFIEDLAPLLAEAASLSAPDLVRRAAERYLDFYDARRLLVRALILGVNPAMGPDAVREGVAPESAQAMAAHIEAYAAREGVRIAGAELIGIGLSGLWLRILLHYLRATEAKRSRKTRALAVDTLVRLTVGGLAEVFREGERAPAAPRPSKAASGASDAAVSRGS